MELQRALYLCERICVTGTRTRRLAGYHDNEHSGGAGKHDVITSAVSSESLLDLHAHVKTSETGQRALILFAQRSVAQMGKRIRSSNESVLFYISTGFRAHQAETLVSLII